MTRDISDSAQLEELFYVLGLVFINIRATDDLSEAQIFADIFHNVPAKISRDFEIAIIMQEIHEKAARHGYERRIAKNV